jgi:hypothetical protein
MKSVSQIFSRQIVANNYVKKVIVSNSHRRFSTDVKGSNPRSIWAKRLESFTQGTVWTEFTPLAVKHQAINLGQGFPDFPGPDFILKNGQTAIANNINQYARSQGHLRLVNALAK